MGNIKVTVQTEERLGAIRDLSAAIKSVAEALSLGTHVTISDCQFTDGNPAVLVDTQEKVTETIVEKI